MKAKRTKFIRLKSGPLHKFISTYFWNMSGSSKKMEYNAKHGKMTVDTILRMVKFFLCVLVFVLVSELPKKRSKAYSFDSAKWMIQFNGECCKYVVLKIRSAINDSLSFTGQNESIAISPVRKFQNLYIRFINIGTSIWYER